MNTPDTQKATETKLSEPLETKNEQELEQEIPVKLRLDPTRYGDWELNGKCVDF